MVNKWILAVGAILLVGLVGFFLLNMNKSANPATSVENTSPTNTPVSEGTDNSPTVSSNEVVIEGNEFAFTPSQVTIKKGEKIKLTFKNNGSTIHDLVVEGLGVSTKRIQPGESDTVEFTAEKTGEFKFLCTVGSHEEQGMVGTLTVQ